MDIKADNLVELIKQASVHFSDKNGFSCHGVLLSYLDCYKYFCSLLAIEREFCLLQGYKVSKDLKDNPTRNINKDTNVIAYYIGTAEIFNNLDKFLSFCFRDKNPMYLKDQRLFNSFLVGCKKVPIRKLNKNNKSYNTLRMTSIELKV